MTQEQKHISVLDGLRGIAILLVIGLHLWQLLDGKYDFISHFAVWGRTGVDLFFVLSGFLITGILLDSRSAPHVFRNFYVRRILRIFPLYFAALIARYFLLPALHLQPVVPFKHLWWFLVYLQNLPLTFVPNAIEGPVHFWSLAVEEQFYLLWPLLVLRLSRRWLLPVCCALVLLAPVMRALLGNYDIYFFTLCRTDSLALGAVVAIFYRQQGGLEQLGRIAKWLPIPLLALLFVGQYWTGQIVPIPQATSVLAIFYASILVVVLQYRSSPVAGILSSKVLTNFGKYSYGMYVLHPFIISEVKRRGGQLTPLTMLLSFAAIYVLARISWILLESPFLRLKRFFEYREVPAQKSGELAVLK